MRGPNHLQDRVGYVGDRFPYAGSIAGFIWGSVIDLSGSYMSMFVGVGAMLLLTIALIGVLAVLDRKQGKPSASQLVSLRPVRPPSPAAFFNA